MTWTYESLKETVQGRTLPLVLVDLDQFDSNLQYFSKLAADHGKSIRIASKSLRVPALLKRAFSAGRPALRGVMCYSAAEAVYLAECGFDDLLVAYPTIQPAEIAAVGAVSPEKRITLTIDSIEQVRELAARWRELRISSALRVCIEMDVSWRLLRHHIGAQRSPVRSIPLFESLLDEILSQPELELAGVMAYESQLAGVPDNNPFTPWKNSAIRWMKRRSQPDVNRRRKDLVEFLKQRGVALPFFNGGGTGSFTSAVSDPSLTEVTIGSGLLQPHLFDYYAAVVCQPAFCFALAVARCPQPDRVTCHGGGFIASGVTGRDRSPLPMFPLGLRVDPSEGFGEVQTPLIVPRNLQGRIQIGDPVFFRPAKAGEIAERFNVYYLMKGGRIVEEVPTYRGLGQCFH